MKFILIVLGFLIYIKTYSQDTVIFVKAIVNKIDTIENSVVFNVKINNQKKYLIISSMDQVPVFDVDSFDSTKIVLGKQYYFICHTTWIFKYKGYNFEVGKNWGAINEIEISILRQPNLQAINVKGGYIYYPHISD